MRTLPDELQADRDPELYTLSVRVNNFPHGRGRYHGVQLSIFRPNAIDIPLDMVKRLTVRNSDDEPVDWQYAAFYIGEELFTADEAAAIEAWFWPKLEPGEWFQRRRNPFPIPGNIMPVSGIPVGGAEDFYMFSKDDNFDCPVPFWAHYDVAGCELDGRPGEYAEEHGFDFIYDGRTGKLFQLDPHDDDVPF